MDKQALKEFTYGGVMELMRNRKFFYHSTIGYSRWTEEGREALCEFMGLVGFKMLEAEEAELNKRSKEMVMNTLKGEKA